MAGQRKRTQRGSNADPQGAWKQDFLEALADVRFIALAAKQIGVGRSTVYRHLDSDPDFREAVDDLTEVITAEAEAELYRRAVQGVEEPVFHKDEQIATITKYSDRLLEVLLRARAPERYRDNVKVEHGGRVGVDLAALSEDELRKLAGDLDDRRSRPTRPDKP